VLQQLVAAGLLDTVSDKQHVQQEQQEPTSVDPAVLAEVSALCDVQMLSSAVLLVSQVASSSSTAELLQEAAQGWAVQAAAAAAAAADACSSRVQLPEQDGARPWWQQEVAGTSVQDAMQLTANVAWLLHCRQKVNGTPSSINSCRVVCDIDADVLPAQPFQDVTAVAVTGQTSPHSCALVSSG
jgi:hypothetical protein